MPRTALFSAYVFHADMDKDGELMRYGRFNRPGLALALAGLAVIAAAVAKMAGWK